MRIVAHFDQEAETLNRATHFAILNDEEENPFAGAPVHQVHQYGARCKYQRWIEYGKFDEVNGLGAATFFADPGSGFLQTCVMDDVDAN